MGPERKLLHKRKNSGTTTRYKTRMITADMMSACGFERSRVTERSSGAPARPFLRNAEDLLELSSEILSLAVVVPISHHVVQALDRFGLRGPAPGEGTAFIGENIDELDPLRRK